MFIPILSNISTRRINIWTVNFSLQTVNKVLETYAEIVKRDFEKYTSNTRVVSRTVNCKVNSA